MRSGTFTCILGGLVVSFIVHMSGAAVIGTAGIEPANITADAIWTGLGVDDRWGNPANWADGRVPTLNDRVIKDPTFDWHQNWPHSRQVTVTIDSSAQAGDWTLYHFGAPPGYPFKQIRIVPGADVRLGTENLDLPSQSKRTYVQTGGTHRADEFTLRGGEYHLEGGTLIAGTITATPDAGVFSMIDGHTEVGQLVVTVFPTYGPGLFRVGGTADVHVTEQFLLRAVAPQTPRTEFTRPIYMDGADFKSECYFGPWWEPQFVPLDPLNNMHLVFRGGLADVALLEVSTFDTSSNDAAGWSGMGTIEIGADQPAYVRLMNEFASWGVPAADVQYVDTLRIGNGSVLDLNGLMLYCRTLDNQGGTFLNGQPIVVPEPATLAPWLLAAVAMRRRRRRPDSWSPRGTRLTRDGTAVNTTIH